MEMQEHARRRFTEPGGIVALWFGILAGPVSWAAQLQFNYSATAYLCGSPWRPIYYVSSIVALLVTALALRTARRSWIAAGRERQTEGDGVVGRTRMMAVAGIGASGFFLFVILVQVLPVLFLDPCLR